MKILFTFLFAALLLLTGCETNSIIVNDVHEREANEIVVFLASKNINAQKIASASANPGMGDTVPLYSISVEEGKATEAMAILNQNGLPRVQGTDLLTLFAKQGLMSSATEETIRYQAGLAQQIANTIRQIDGVIDATVQLSFPPTTTAAPAPGTTQTPTKVTAAVFVKHQGILDDPNSHLVTKIKRLVAGSVNGLDLNDVTVISERSRFTDITLGNRGEALSNQTKEYVSIWSIVMSKHSAAKFRLIFFTLTAISVLFAVIIGWMLWKFYPLLRNQGVKELFNPIPVENKEKPPQDKQP